MLTHAAAAFLAVALQAGSGKQLEFSAQSIPSKSPNAITLVASSSKKHYHPHPGPQKVHPPIPKKQS